MIDWWQHLLEHIDPIVFTVGFVSVHWYAILWLLGWMSVWYVGKRVQFRQRVALTDAEWEDLVLILFAGALLGGHIGYSLLYQPLNSFYYPLQFFSPYSFETGNWIGIRGMSFYGGLIGVVVVLWFQARKYKKNFLVLADLVSLLAPIAIFFGRLGNFFNHELPGRVTEVPWGMYIPVLPKDVMFFGETLRHPSSLYEAFGEGIILLFFLLFLSRRSLAPGMLASSFLIGYGIIRFILEFFRELDLGSSFLLGVFTFGQILSFLSILFGSILLLWLTRKNRGKIDV